MNAKKRRKFSCFIVVVLLLVGCNNQNKLDKVDSVKDNGNRAIAYVTVPASDNWRWIGEDGENVVSYVDTRYVTHINFAFGMIEAYQFDPQKEGRPLMSGEVASTEAYKSPVDNKYHYRATLNGWIEEMDKQVDGSKYLEALVKLKEQKPELKVLLSIGGWDSDGFCYMAKTKDGREEFIDSCIDLIEEFQLDGIDLDWEYPTNGGWGSIASCDNCVEDASQLIREFRQVLDNKYANNPKLLTIASGDPWVDQETFKSLDYMNVMCYDYDSGSGESQAPMSFVEDRMSEHVEMVTDTWENRSKINLGIPFYNEGGPFLVPYYQGFDGYVDASAEITANKMNWVKDYGFGGGFYWAYSMDTFEQDVEDVNDQEVKILQRTLYETLNGKVE